MGIRAGERGQAGGDTAVSAAFDLDDSHGRFAHVDAKTRIELQRALKGKGVMRDLPLDANFSVDWIRAAHATSQWTTSVCTGSLLLGAAGLLTGLEATTRWAAMDDLARLGARPTLQRVVFQGKIVTAAGVSAGIDMALTLAARIAGEDVAKAIQLGIEYDPQPPFDSGHPRKASPEAVQLIAQMMQGDAERATVAA